jgi:hypothetical protein
MAGTSGQMGEEGQGVGNGQGAEERDGKANMAGDDIGVLVAKIGRLDTESARNITCAAATQSDEKDERIRVGEAMKSEVNWQEGTAETKEGKERQRLCPPPPPHEQMGGTSCRRTVRSQNNTTEMQVCKTGSMVNEDVLPPPPRKIPGWTNIVLGSRC